MLFTCASLLFLGILNPSVGENAANEQPKKTFPTEFQCGKSNVDFSQVEGKPVEQKASVGNFPWQAVVFHKTSDSWGFGCAGSLVSPRAVLSVAHCFKCEYCKPVERQPKDVLVGLGQVDKAFNSTEHTQNIVAVKEIRIHPHFIGAADYYGNDISILILEKEVDISSYVMPACLDLLNEHVTSGQYEGYLTSWAYSATCEECDLRRGLQMYSRTTIRDYATCYNTANTANTTSSVRSRFGSMLRPDKICSDFGVYKGDSGVGLTVVVNGSHFLNGIASTKLKMSGELAYTFCTSVSYHRDWIKENLV